VTFTDPADLPEEAAAEKAYYRHTGIRSGVVIPLQVPPCVVGAISLSTVSHALLWSDASVRRLTLLGHLYATAIERGRIELQSQAVMASYQAVVQSSPDAIYVVDPNGRIELANARAARVCGVNSPEDLVGVDAVEELVAPEDRQQARENLIAGGKGQMRTGVEYRFLRADGSHYIGELNAAPIQGSRGRPQGVVATVRDVTDRLQREAQLEESVAFNAVVMASSPVGIATYRSDGQCVTCNEVIADMVGATIEQVRSQNFRQLESWRVGGLLADANAVLQQGGLRRREMRVKSSFRASVWLDCRVSRFMSDGEPHLLLVIDDIRERKNLEAQLQQARKMESLGTLAGGVAHDMNNILTVVTGLGSLLEEEMQCSQDARLSEVRAITASAKRGRDLVAKLLGFARKGSQSKQVSAIDELVREVVGILSHSLPKRISVNVQLRDALSPVDCDRQQLVQTLLNVCLNANDALEGSGTITISASNQVLVGGSHDDLAAGDYVQLQIVDDGRGMDEETLARVFEPFFTTKGVGKGTGLGLSMAYGVVRDHGGSISVDSRPSKGTAVTVLLPAAMRQEAPSPGGV
jgi:PAS domain S-box-containing protein